MPLLAAMLAPTVPGWPHVVSVAGTLATGDMKYGTFRDTDTGEVYMVDQTGDHRRYNHIPHFVEYIEEEFSYFGNYCFVANGSRPFEIASARFEVNIHRAWLAL